jgi:hypothetical protein
MTRPGPGLLNGARMPEVAMLAVCKLSKLITVIPPEGLRYVHPETAGAAEHRALGRSKRRALPRLSRDSAAQPRRGRARAS